MAKITLAEGKRVAITNAQGRRISKMYLDLAKGMEKEAKGLEGKENVSSIARKAYLESFAKEMKQEVESINLELEKSIPTNMMSVSRAVVDDNNKLLGKSGLKISGAYHYVPRDVVQDIVSGNLYKGKWTLSKAIWGGNKKTLSDIDSIVARGIAANKSTYDIAKDLEKYVNPKAAKDWDWSKVYPGVNKKVDYNAQRLARTMVSHAYQQSFVRTTNKNPFIEAYEWLTSGGDRVCPICLGRASADEYGLGAGIYPKDNLPMDHPNGMCVFGIVMLDDYLTIGNKLADWVNGEGDENLNRGIDEFVEQMLGVEVVNVPKSEPETLGKNIESYVGGGYSSIKNALSKEEYAYVESNMTKWDKHMYRVEDTKFTADGLKVGDVFSFKDGLRSFTRSGDYANDIIGQDVVDKPVMFQTVGVTKQFNIDKFAGAYYEDQKESFVGGFFLVDEITKTNIDGVDVDVIKIIQKK